MPGQARLWLLGGVLAPILYVATVILGGVLTPGYSHVAGPVSALMMDGAPAATVLIPLFALYNALLAAFAFTVRDALRAGGAHLSIAAPIALVVVAIAGAAMLVYPMDPLGAPSTEEGRLHVFFAAIAAVSTMGAVLFTATSLGRNAGWRAFAAYSWVTLVAIVIAGIWAATAAGEMSPIMGLAERTVIGAFLQWLLVFAVSVLLRRRAAAI